MTRRHPSASAFRTDLGSALVGQPCGDGLVSSGPRFFHKTRRTHAIALLRRPDRSHPARHTPVFLRARPCDLSGPSACCIARLETECVILPAENTLATLRGQNRIRF
jgi:hypothetical protein